MANSELWSSCDLKDMNLEKVPGMTSRGYVMRKKIDVCDGDVDNGCAKLGVVGRIDRKSREVEFDVYYSLGGKTYFGPWEFKPYPFERFNVLCLANDGQQYVFHDSALANASWKMMPEIENYCRVDCTKSGGLCFKYSAKFWKDNSGVNLTFMNYSFLGVFLYLYRNSLILAAKYPNLNTVSDIIDVKRAFEDIDEEWWRIADEFYDQRLNEQIDLIRKEEEHMHKLENKRDEIYGKCADSLNALSVKFGLEIPV